MFIIKNILIVVLFLTGIYAVSCNSSRSAGNRTNNENVKNEKPKSPIPLSPDQADVKATVKDYSGNDDRIIASIEINEVLRYGASTPHLTKGSEIKLLIPEQLSDNQQNKFKKENLLLMRISFNRGLDNKGSWKLVSIIN